MNYAFGVEFLEVDPLELGIENFEGAAEEDRAEMQKQIKVDESRYRGIHGTAILSAAIRNYDDVFHNEPSWNPVIPPKAGIQDL